MGASQFITEIGQPPWARDDIRMALKEFVRLYDMRPFDQNRGGMLAPHMFATWFIVTKLQPTHIVESGVFKGQGTWLLAKSAPNAEITCIEPSLRNIEFRLPAAQYQRLDFAESDWSHLPRESTLFFFDDHQDAVERVRIAAILGFRHLIFEDNYPTSQGDCHSLKKVFMCSQSARDRARNNDDSCGSSSSPPRWSDKDACNKTSQVTVSEDAAFLLSVLEVYYEFPPVVRCGTTRWGDPWEDSHYPTQAAILKPPIDRLFELFERDADSYTWLCYARLRARDDSL